MSANVLADLERLVGSVVTLRLPDPLNPSGLAYEMHGRLVSGPVAHGYVLPSGGWGARKISEADVPAYLFGFVPKGKRKPRLFRTDYVLAVFASDGRGVPTE